MLLRKINHKKGYDLIEYDEGIILLVDPKLAAKLNINEEFDLVKLLADNEEFALQYAMKESIKYLSAAMRTARQTLDNLLKRGVQKKCALMTVEKLVEVKYLDDNAYAAFYVSNAILSGMGKRNIQTKLAQKGLSEQVIKDALTAYGDEALSENARIFTQKKNRLLAKYPPLIRREKLIRAAIQKGFDPKDIYTVLDELLSADKGDYSGYFEPLIKRKAQSLLKKGMDFKAMRSKLYSEFVPKGADKGLIDKYCK